MGSAPRHVLSYRSISFVNETGLQQTQYEITWDDGTIETFAHERDLPKEVRLFTSGYVSSPDRQAPSWLGLSWVHEPDRLTLDWPSYCWLEIVLPFGYLALIPLTAWTCVYWFTEKPLKLWPVALVGCVILITVAKLLLRLFRSQLIFERNIVRQRKDFGFFTREETWPKSEVLEAILLIRSPDYSGKDRDRSTLTVRIRTESEIQWRRIGGSFSRTRAQALSSEIRRFVKTRIASE